MPPPSIVQKIYHQVQLAAWAALAAFALVSVVFVSHDLPARQAAIARQQQLRDIQEVSDLCEKLGKPVLTPEHTLCTIDLRRYRQRIETRIANAMVF